MHGFSQLSPTERKEWMESRSPTPTPQLSRYPKVPKILAGLILGLVLTSLALGVAFLI